jgi:hypothetical protein
MMPHVIHYYLYRSILIYKKFHSCLSIRRAIMRTEAKMREEEIVMTNDKKQNSF